MHCELQIMMVLQNMIIPSFSAGAFDLKCLLNKTQVETITITTTPTMPPIRIHKPVSCQNFHSYNKSIAEDMDMLRSKDTYVC